MSRSISGYYNTTVSLTSADNPVTVNLNGTIVVTGGGGKGGGGYSALTGTVGATNWTVTNFGLLSAGSGDGLRLGNTKYTVGVDLVTNTSFGRIVGGGSGIRMYGAAGSRVVNAGSIGGGHGVVLGHSSLTGAGTVSNSGTINGTFGSGVYFGNDGSTLVNSGRISGGAGTAVQFSGLSNLVVMYPKAVFGGIVDAGVFVTSRLELASAASTGSISGIGSQYHGFSQITIDSFAQWFIYGSNTLGSGVRLDNHGTLRNLGTITATSGTLQNSGRIDNFGTISGEVSLSAGGYIDNRLALTGQAGVLTSSGVAVSGPSLGAATVANEGTVTASIGVRLPAGGAIINDGGVISTDLGGVYIAGSGSTVFNNSTIAATGHFGLGVYLRGGAALTNDTGGVIQGYVTGVYNNDAGFTTGLITNNARIAGTGPNGIGVLVNDVLGGATLVNSGTITGASGTAVQFNGGGNLVVVSPGARFTGVVNGGTGSSNTLELATGASAGTLTNLGAGFVNFATLRFDSGAHWTVEGYASGLPGKITGFTAGDTIDVDGFVAVSDTFANNALVLTNSIGGHVTLGIQGTFSSGGFTLAPDGSGGTDITLATTPPPPKHPPADFNGDGTSDVLWRNNSNGDTGYWRIANNTIAGWTGLGQSPTTYNIVGVGDFNGDGTADVLWRNPSSGDTGYWTIVNNQIGGWIGLGQSPTAYSVVGVGDFTGDGTADVLWRNNGSGDTGYWRIANNTIAGWSGLGQSPTTYSVAGVGDFTGDGTADILWRNATTGDTGYWRIANNTIAGWTGLGQSPTTYNVVGVGDFSGDGIPDVLWRNNNSGDTGYWTIANNQISGWVGLGQSPTTYNVVGVGDFNGDGVSDILWRNPSSGDTGYWRIANNTIAGWTGLGQAPTTYTVENGATSAGAEGNGRGGGAAFAFDDVSPPRSASAAAGTTAPAGSDATLAFAAASPTFGLADATGSMPPAQEMWRL